MISEVLLTWKQSQGPCDVLVVQEIERSQLSQMRFKSVKSAEADYHKSQSQQVNLVSSDSVGLVSLEWLLALHQGTCSLMRPSVGRLTCRLGPLFSTKIPTRHKHFSHVWSMFTNVCKHSHTVTHSRKVWMFSWCLWKCEKCLCMVGTK